MFLKIRNVSDKSAITLLKISEFCIRFMLILPIITLLYQDKGVSIGDFFLIQGMYAFACFLFEIPSGYMSDCLSRRKVLISGALVAFISHVILFFACGFWHVLLAEMLLGVADALFSGTQEAYAYDLLKRMNKQDDFLKEYGSIATWAQTSGFIAALIGATVYVYIGNWIVGIEVIATGIGVLCLMALPELYEVRRCTGAEKTHPLKDIAGIIKMSVKHPELKWLMLFPAMFGAFTLVMMWVLQPTMQAVGVATAVFGLFVGINQFMRVVYSHYAHRIFNAIGTRGVIVGLMAMLICAIFAVILAMNINNMWLIYGLCVIIACVPACQKLSHLVFNTLIHERISSQERGTVLSIGSMYTTIMNGTMMILMKPLLDGTGIQCTMIILLCMAVLLVIPLIHVWKMQTK